MHASVICSCFTHLMMLSPGNNTSQHCIAFPIDCMDCGPFLFDALKEGPTGEH